MNFRDFQLNIDLTSLSHLIVSKTVSGKVFIKDIIRKKWLVLQPEEWVRQLMILHLIQNLGIPINRIQVEKQIKINGLLRRFDIIVYDLDIKPYMIIECKAPPISLHQSTFDQVAAYNHVLGAPYIIVTNGLLTYCALVEKIEGSYKFLNDFPVYF